MNSLSLMRFVVILIPLFMISCSDQPFEFDQAKAEKELSKAKIVTWRKLYDNADADGLNKFLAEDFVLIGGESIFTTKAEEIEWLRNNKWTGPDDFVYTIKDIVFLSNDAAIVYGIGTSTRKTEDGKPCNHSYISSNTFRRENGIWRPVTSHISDVRCSPIE